MHWSSSGGLLNACRAAACCWGVPQAPWDSATLSHFTVAMALAVAVEGVVADAEVLVEAMVVGGLVGGVETVVFARDGTVSTRTTVLEADPPQPASRMASTRATPERCHAGDWYPGNVRPVRCSSSIGIVGCLWRNGCAGPR
jgi:hypothetical protein